MMANKKTSKAITRVVLDAAQILDADDLPREWVPVPEWGGGVYVRSMMAVERDAWEQLQLKSKRQNARGHLCALVSVNEAGERLFTDEQAVALGKKAAGAVDRIFSVAIRLNGFGVRDIEDLEKN